MTTVRALQTVGTSGRVRWKSVIVPVALVGLVVSWVSASAVEPGMAAAAPVAHSAPAGWARPNVVGLPADWTQTWSTGVLPDTGQPIALSSPVLADLDGQPSVVVGDRRGYVRLPPGQSVPIRHVGDRLADHRRQWADRLDPVDHSGPRGPGHRPDRFG